jgi:glutamate 5-kinase
LTTNSDRPLSLRYRKAVVKLGTNLLTGGRDRLDLEIMAGLVSQIAGVREAGGQVVVVSSGAIAAGRHALGLTKRAERSVATLQALAAVGQSRLMQAYEQLFAWHGVTVGQALLTRADLTSKRAAANARRTLEGLLALGVVPIVNENDVVATEEIGASFGDNDNLSAAVANLLAADLLVLLTDQEGLYDADPRSKPDATLVRRVPRVTDEILRMTDSAPGTRGRGGMASKVRAAAEATSWGTTVIVAGGRMSDVLVRAVQGHEVGTLFEPWGQRRSADRRRSLGRAFVRGTLVVDEGAAKALKGGRSSLLAVGVKEVRGAFQAGDVVEVLGPDMTAVARGAVEYPSDVVDRIKGLRSARVKELLTVGAGDGNGGGVYAGDEVVHLDNLVVLS